MRTIKFENIENFRDLGGYPCSFGETSFGVIYRSATLAYASKKDVDHMAEIGIKTVIDLREDSVKASLPSPMLGDPRFTYIALPVNGNGRIPVDHEDQVESYMEMLYEPRTARNIFQAILNAPKPLVFHCNAGKDRTGAFSMILLMLAGVPFEDINADYMMSYPLLPKMTANTRAFHKEEPELLLVPNTDFLPCVHNAFYDRYGSLSAYFEAIGMSDDEFVALSNLLGKQEKSCGVVCVRDGRVLVEHMNHGHYSLPKGHVEPEDADEHATAARELKEETGLEVASFIPGFRTSVHYSPAEGCIKEVVFFLAEVKEGKPIIQKTEVQDIYWLRPEDALITLSHDSDRGVIKKAFSFLGTR